MTVELTIVGIRNYCEGGEEGYPVLFARLPIDSIVYLRKEPTGSRFPGSVSVWDDNNRQIGNISKTERRFIELEITEGEMLPAMISGHSAEHNCMYIKAENTKGFKEPFIREIKLMEDETVFPLTDYDQKIQQFTAMMKTKIKMLKDGMVKNAESLLATAHEYALYCCESLDGETSFNREDILRDLKSLAVTYPQLNEVHSAIFERHKDVGRRYNDVKTKAYLDQYNRIKEKAFSVEGNSRSQMDDYVEKLKFANSGKLSKEVIEKEIANLSELLANEMMKSFEKNTETDETFATALYSLNYSMTGIYRLYTRRIKLDYLKAYIQGFESDFHTDDPQPSAEQSFENLIFDYGIFDTSARVVRLRDEIGARIRGAELSDAGRFDDERARIDPAKQNEWYYIWKMLAESKLLNRKATVREFLRQMMSWFPEVFEAEADDTQKSDAVIRMEKSISAEKKLWCKNGVETPFRDMNHTWKALYIDPRKFQQMYPVCKELFHALQNLKSEIPA